MEISEAHTLMTTYDMTKGDMGLRYRAVSVGQSPLGRLCLGKDERFAEKVVRSVDARLSPSVITRGHVGIESEYFKLSGYCIY